jgi:hypothetical protein
MKNLSYRISSMSDEELQKALENHFIVLEGLEVSADEAGVYTNGADKRSDAVLSPELKGKVSKWLKAADALSQGKSDIIRDEPSQSVAWESLGLEADDQKSFWRRLWEAIVHICEAIMRFLKEMVSHEQIVKIQRATDALQERLAEARHQHPQSGHVVVQTDVVRVLTMHGHSKIVINDLEEVFDRTHHAMEVIAGDYTKMVLNTYGDLDGTLAHAFKAEFKDSTLNRDLYNALSVYDPRHVSREVGEDIGEEATHLAAVYKRLSPEINGHSFTGATTSASKPLLNNTRLAFYSINLRFWDAASTIQIKYEPSVAAKTMTDFLCAPRIKMIGHTVSEAAQSNEMPTMDLGDIGSLIYSVKKTEHCLDGLYYASQKLQRRDAAFLSSIKNSLSAESNVDVSYIDRVGHVMRTISVAMTYRAAQPISGLFTSAKNGAIAAIKLANAHLHDYA